MTSLRIVVQHRQTKQFYKGDASWTSNEGEARDFPNAINAFNFACEKNLGDVEVIFRTKRFYSSLDEQAARPPVRAF